MILRFYFLTCFGLFKNTFLIFLGSSKSSGFLSLLKLVLSRFLAGGSVPSTFSSGSSVVSSSPPSGVSSRSNSAVPSSPPPNSGAAPPSGVSSPAPGSSGYSSSDSASTLSAYASRSSAPRSTLS
jgi:hypothetical protein